MGDKKFYFFCVTLVAVILFLNFISAEVLIGNQSNNINLVYGSSQILSGWINISLNNEPTNSNLNAFNQNINIKDFLDKNSVYYSCIPTNCNSSYSSLGSGVSSKTISINAMDSKVIGLRLTGQITGIDSISFNVNTNAGKSCLNPISIDLLDDGLIEWKSDNASDDYSCYGADYFGCYNSADASATAQITNNPYCEKINLRAPSRNFQIGADIIKGTGDNNNVSFKMEINTGTEDKICNFSTNIGNEGSCVIQLDRSLSSDIRADVCLSVINSNDNAKYQIQYETVNPCGYSGNQQFDFPIFAKAGKFREADNITFNQDVANKNGINLATEIYSYVNDNYLGNCTPECIIPMRIIAGANQDTTFSNLNLVYRAGVSKTENNFYDLQTSNAFINSNFQKLYLEKANFSVPDNLGTKLLVLNLGSSEIFNGNIEIENIPSISDVNPKTFSALVPVTFIASVQSSSSNLTYTWNFGDGSSEVVTNKSSVMHSYPNIGNYNLKIKVSDSNGENINNFTINAGSPKNYINNTIANYRNDISNVKSQINNLPTFVRTEIEKKANLDFLSSSIKDEENKYLGAVRDSDYVAIMKDLVALKVPYQLNISEIIKPSTFLVSEDQLNLDILNSAGVGNIENNSDFFTKLNKWILDNLDLSVESNTYSLYFRDNSEDSLTSDIKLTLKPKKSLSNVYVIINGNPSEIKLSDNTNSKSIGNHAIAITFLELTDSQTIEFLYPDKISLTSFPVIISPKFSELPISPGSIVCNNNKICEVGEDNNNCPNDCKSWKLTITLLIILFFIALVVYIILQEWYKKYYESKLFSNKNQLFNLVNFMNNSMNQGMRKNEIFDKLHELGWGSEQLSYAWKKLRGERTGMWELPVFKWLENKQVKEEIQKRQGMSRAPSF